MSALGLALCTNLKLTSLNPISEHGTVSRFAVNDDTGTEGGIYLGQNLGYVWYTIVAYMSTGLLLI